MRNSVAAWKAGARWPLPAGLLLLFIVGIGIGEARGWPWLVEPAQSWLSRTLDRRVEIGPDGAGDAGPTRIGLIGNVRVQAPRIVIAAPAWSQAPHTLLAHDAALVLGYIDLWRAWRGQPLHVRLLEADALDLRLERDAQDRASWQFGQTPGTAPTRAMTALPRFGTLRVGKGQLAFVDALTPARIDASFAFSDGSSHAVRPAADAVSTTASAPVVPASTVADDAGGMSVRAGETATGGDTNGPAPATLAPGERGIALKGAGRYRGLPVRIDLRTTGVVDLLAGGQDAVAQPVQLRARVGDSELRFDGSTTDPLHVAGLRGTFSLSGPSLAAVGDPLGITLPATPAFRANGTLAKEAATWEANIADARIGASRLEGVFTYDTRRETPLLTGRLGGSRLLLSDLGPAVGAPAADDPDARPTSASGRVIPDRPFDLPSLRRMDADVAVDIAELNTGTDVIEQLRPLRAHLLLADGVLTVSDIDARTAEGRLEGHLQLDGRARQAQWTADLHLRDVDLARWLKLERAAGTPPYVSGRLDGQVRVAGTGRSTAEILASLDGGLRMHVRDATLSHLLVEAAGVDLAQALGLAIRGDAALPVLCNVADFGIDNGVARPKAFVIITRDSTIWLDGSVSLRTETLDLRAVVSPKDFSPLSLRTPVHVRGSLREPAVSLELNRLAGKAGAAALLALLNPLAAIIPFIDPGASQEAQRVGAQCDALVRKQGWISAPVPRPKHAAMPQPPAPAR